jgi:hypothetical protein
MAMHQLAEGTLSVLQQLCLLQAVLETHCILQPPVNLQLRTRGLGTVEVRRSPELAAEHLLITPNRQH